MSLGILRNGKKRALLTLILLLAILAGFRARRDPDNIQEPAASPVSSPETAHAPADFQQESPGRNADPLLDRFYLAHIDLSVPQPLSVAMARVTAQARELNYLKRPLLENLHYVSTTRDPELREPLVSCPLAEPTLRQVLTWFGAQLRADFTLSEDGGVSFPAWPEPAPDDRAIEGDFPFAAAWLRPPQGESADPVADSLPVLEPLQLLDSWGVSVREQIPVVAVFAQRRLKVKASSASLRQIAVLTRLKQENQALVLSVSLHTGDGAAAALATDRIVDAAGLDEWIQARHHGAADRPSTASAASGQTVSIECLIPVAGNDAQPDWRGLWAGLQLRAEGEVVRVSGTVENRTDGEAGDAVSLEAEFEALVPRGETAIISLRDAASLAETSMGEAAVTVH